MPFSQSFPQATAETLVESFFRQTAGRWRSERRYYTLQNGETQEVVSFITVDFLEPACPELIHLAQLHQLPDPTVLVCGTRVTWESSYTRSKRKPTTGETIFGVQGATLYRDRGFATSMPVTAQVAFPDPKTMTLRTEYDGSTFEEELKLIGTRYRTRQTIISRAGEEIMIGQYLETRC